MHKKGVMISVMIIIGIIILAIFFLAFAMRQQLVGLMKPRTSDVSGVQIYVEDCIDAVTQYAVYKIGSQGGSLALGPAHFSNSFLEVNYAFDNGNVFPPLDSIQSEIESFVNSNLKNCTAGFGGFKAKGMQVKEGDVSSSVVFGLSSMIVTVTYPVEVTSGDRTFTIEKFQRDVPVRLKTIHSETDSFMSGFGNSGYNMTWLRNMGSNVFIVPEDGSDLLVEENTYSRILGENYLFLSAIR